MSSHDREPVIIGVADIVNRTTTPHEPLVLIGDAVDAALKDASSGDSVRSAVNELVVVKCWTWPYDDFAGLVAKRSKLGSRGNIHTRHTEHGGNSPVKSLDEVCREIVSGDDGVKVITGGEALDSRKCTIFPGPSRTDE